MACQIVVYMYWPKVILITVTLFIPEMMRSRDSLLVTAPPRMAQNNTKYITRRTIFKISLNMASLSSNSLSVTWKISYGFL